MGLFSKSQEAEVVLENKPQANNQQDDLKGQLDAINRSQAVIEFELDGTIIKANENFLNALGYTLEEIQGKHHSIFCESHYTASSEYKAFWDNLRQGNFSSGEYMRLTKDGTEIWIQASYNPVFDSEGNPLKVVNFASDVTAQKKQFADFQGKIDAINKSQAVIEFELDGTIVKANENFLTTVGYSLDEIVGNHHSMFVDPKYAKSNEYAQFWTDLASGKFQANQHKRFGKGGKEIWIQASYNPIFDANDNPIKVVKFATDITETMKLEKAIAVGNDVASSVSQMVTSIEEIAQSVSRTANLAKDAKGIAEATGRSVESLDENSREIGEVVSVIQELADQTNLLALNATIEAARAGESGRSFAVVASEVKELANATAKATQNIEQSVFRIQSCISEVVGSTTKITESIGEVSINTTTVAAAVDEQSATMAALGQTAEQLRSLSAQVS